MAQVGKQLSNMDKQKSTSLQLDIEDNFEDLTEDDKIAIYNMAAHLLSFKPDEQVRILDWFTCRMQNYMG
jgi:hypothetical protein